LRSAITSIVQFSNATGCVNNLRIHNSQIRSFTQSIAIGKGKADMDDSKGQSEYLNNLVVSKPTLGIDIDGCVGLEQSQNQQS